MKPVVNNMTTIKNLWIGFYNNYNKTQMIQNIYFSVNQEMNKRIKSVPAATNIQTL